MKPINQIVGAAQNELQIRSTKLPEKISKRTDIPISWVSGIFKVFQARYLAKWDSAINGIERLAVTEWSKGLSGLTSHDIKNGLEVWNEEWPPSLPEFRAACLSMNDDLHNTLAYTKGNYIPIDKSQKAKEETANREREELAKLGILRKRRKS